MILDTGYWMMDDGFYQVSVFAFIQHQGSSITSLEAHKSELLKT